MLLVLTRKEYTLIAQSLTPSKKPRKVTISDSFTLYAMVNEKEKMVYVTKTGGDDVNRTADALIYHSKRRATLGKNLSELDIFLSTYEVELKLLRHDVRLRDVEMTISYYEDKLMAKGYTLVKRGSKPRMKKPPRPTPPMWNI